MIREQRREIDCYRTAAAMQIQSWWRGIRGQRESEKYRWDRVKSVASMNILVGGSCWGLSFSLEIRQLSG